MASEAISERTYPPLVTGEEMINENTMSVDTTEVGGWATYTEIDKLNKNEVSKQVLHSKIYTTVKFLVQ